MKPSAKRAISLLISVVLFVVALVIYALLIRPAYDEIVKLRGVLVGKQDLLKEQRGAIDRVNTLVEQYQGTGNLQEIVNLSLPDNEELSSVFSQLYAIARFTGANIEVFGVQPLALKPVKAGTLMKSLGTLRVNLRLSGSYEAFKNFVRGLETNIRVMDVISAKKEGDAHNLVVDAYYQPK